MHVPTIEDLTNLVHREESVTPAVCFDACNTAFLIAQSTGATPALCKKGSDFRDAYETCDACIQASGENGTALDPQFVQFIEYCHLNAFVTSTDRFTMTDGAVTTLVYVVPTQDVATTTASSTTSRRSTSTIARQTSSSAVGTPPASSDSPRAGSTNKAWIAGPVVGAVVGSAIILGALFYFWRKRTKTNKLGDSDPTLDKPQLHGDSVPKPLHEVGANGVYEMEGNYSPPIDQPMSEVPANEAPAVELPTGNPRRSVNL